VSQCESNIEISTLNVKSFMTLCEVNGKVKNVNGVQKVAGSNPVAPTSHKKPPIGGFLYVYQ
jgi:hypothetical protein